MTNVIAFPGTDIRDNASPGLTPCQRLGPQPWFSQRPAELERAKALCQDCPMLRQCLAGAISRREPHGVWGGQIFDHGVIVEHKRGRGRPRKVQHDRLQRPCIR